MRCEEMIIHHRPESPSLDLAPAIARHSADRMVCYKHVDGQPLLLACFFPENLSPRQRCSTIFLIHGGGWSCKKVFTDQAGWQGDYLGFLARYYANRGFVCISIDYRLIENGRQESGFGLPELCQDCCDAVSFAAAHAGEYGIDTKRLFLLGESAGGYLAAMLVHMCPVRFHKVFLVNPITDLRMENWRVSLPSGCDVTRFSPVCRISGETPETILFHGTNDKVVSSEHSRAFHQEMERRNRPCTLHLLEGAGHAFFLAEYYKDGTAFCKMAVDIISRILEADCAEFPRKRDFND